MTNQYVWHPGIDFANDFHTYYLVWKEGDIQKWVDNNWVKGTNFTWNGSDPEVLINLAIGGSINNNPTAATFPAVYSIDSFKVYVK
jgi:beta-glucanase (GH16 family)